MMEGPTCRRQVTFTVIGGFLGAGKTSLLNKVLAQTKDIRFAVLVNDFGALNIDQSLIESADSEVMQLSNGCICCSLAGGLVDAMVALMKYRDSIDHILIEASGVSYPRRIMDFARIDPDLRPGMTLVLVDAASLAAQRADSKLAEVIAAQMDGADLFLLTKTDIAGEAEIAEARRYLTETQPLAPVLAARADDPGILAMLLANADGEALVVQDVAVPHDDFVSMALTADGLIDEPAFRKTCASISGEIIRGKGFVHFANGLHVWQQCGRLVDIDAVADSSDNSSRIVLIGTGQLDAAESVFGRLGFSRLTT